VDAVSAADVDENRFLKMQNRLKHSAAQGKDD